MCVCSRVVGGVCRSVCGVCVCRSVWCVCSRGVGVACVGLCVVCV